MKQNVMKAVSVLLVLCMTLTLFSATAFAVDYTTVYVDSTAEYQDGAPPEATEGAVYKTLADAANAIDNYRYYVYIKDSNWTLTENTEIVTKANFYLRNAEGHELTIDLNGHTLTLGRCNFQNYGTLNIIDSSQDKDGKLARSVNPLIDNYGTLNLSDAALETTGTIAVRAQANSVLNMKSGTLTAGDNPIYVVGSNPTINVESGTLNGGSNVNCQRACAVNLGTENAPAGTVVLNCALSVNASATLNLNGATIDSVVGTIAEGSVFNNCLFKTDVSPQLPAGYKCVETLVDGETFYAIETLANEDATAIITRDGNSLYYGDAAAAVRNLQDNDTLTFYGDYTEELPIINERNLTIDLNGRNISNLNIRTTVSDSTGVPPTSTVKNGSIDDLSVSTSNSKYQQYLKLDNVTIDNSLDLGYAYVDYSEALLDKMIDPAFAANAENPEYLYSNPSYLFSAGADTAYLLADYEGDSTMAVSQSGTIDLNGHSYVYSGTSNYVIYPSGQNQTLTVRNGSVKSLRAITDPDSDTSCIAQISSNNVALNLDGVSLEGENAYVVVTHGTATNVTLNITNSTITNTSEDPGLGLGIYFPSADSSLTIDNTTINASTGVGVKGGTVTVKGSTVINANGVENIPEAAINSGINSTGDAIYVEGNYNFAINVNIEGGTFTSANGEAVRMLFETENANDPTVTITGGTFSSKPADNITVSVPNGSLAVENTDGTFEIVVDDETAVAKIGNTGYVDLQDAIDAASDGSTITLLKNIETDTQFVISGKALDIDGGNFTIKASDGYAKSDWTSSDNSVIDSDGLFYINNGADVSLQNITLDANNMARVIAVNNSDLTINNGTTIQNGGASDYPFSGGGVYYKSGTGLVVNGGVIRNNQTTSYGGGVFYGNSGGGFTMTGGEITGNTAAGYAGGVWIASTATMNMTGGTISGNTAAAGDGVFINANSSSNPDNSGLTVDGGTITDEVWIENWEGQKTTLTYTSGSLSDIKTPLTIADNDYSTIVSIDNPTAGSTYTGGEIAQNANVTIVGTSALISENLTIPAGSTLTIPENVTVEVADEVTLTNNGVIAVNGILDADASDTSYAGSGAVNVVANGEARLPQGAMPTATPAPTAEPVATATAEPEATATADPTVTSEPEATATADPTVTSEPEATATADPTVTSEPEATATADPTVTSEPEATATADPTVTSEPEATATAEPTVTSEPEATATADPTVTSEPEATATADPTVTSEPEATATADPTVTSEPEATATADPTVTSEPEATATADPTVTSEPEATATADPTVTSEPEATATADPTVTSEPEATATADPTVTSEPEATATADPTVTSEPEATATADPTVTSEPEATATADPTVTSEPEATATADPTVTSEPEATATADPTVTSEPEATATADPTVTSEPEATATADPTVTSEPEATATADPTVTSEPEATATADPTATSEPEATATAEPTATSEPEATATAEPTATSEPEATATADPTYNITTSVENGAIQYAPSTPSAGDTVELTLEPNFGYKLLSLTVTAGDQTIEVTDNAFVMPASDVNITAEFEPMTSEETIAAADELSNSSDEMVATITEDLGGNINSAQTNNITAVQTAKTALENAVAAYNDDPTDENLAAIVTAGQALTDANRQIAAYAVTWTVPEHISAITVRVNGAEIESGDTVYPGSTVSVSVTAASGYTVRNLAYNGNAFSGSFAMPAENVEITCTAAVNGGGSSGGGSGGGGGGWGGSTTTATATPSPTSTPAATTDPSATATPGTSTGEQVFADVPTTYWGYEYIMALYEAGIVDGYGDNTFLPEGTITRAEFTKMTVELFGLSAADTDSQFLDCAADDWYTPYVIAAQEAGMVTGVSDEWFGAADTITREDMATIIGRYLALTTTADSTFADADDIADYAVGYVTAMVSAGYITGYEDGTFQPEANATRAEAATIIARVMNDISAPSATNAPSATTAPEATASPEA